MSAETQASEQALHYVWKGTKVTLKFSGKGALRLCALLKAKREARPREGLVDLHRLHTSTQSARVISIPTSALNGFDGLARKYNVMYALIQDRQNPDAVEVMVRGEDMELINRIFEECSILEDIEETCRVDVEESEPSRDGAQQYDWFFDFDERGEDHSGENPHQARTHDSHSARDSDFIPHAAAKQDPDKKSLRKHLTEIKQMLAGIRRGKGKPHDRNAR